jgi:acetyl-CoA carboxylase biotin carboxyl carrier protein
MSSGKSKKNAVGPDGPRVELVRELASIVESHALTELIYDSESLTLTLRRGVATAIHAIPAPPIVHAPALVAAPHAAPAASVHAGDRGPREARPAASEGNGAYHVVTSPFVGTFYCSPNPDSPPYVEVGQRVEKGQVLCIVEAMKLMNEIEADQAGVVAAVLVDNAEPVEYGQALFKIAPA